MNFSSPGVPPCGRRLGLVRGCAGEGSGCAGTFQRMMLWRCASLTRQGCREPACLCHRDAWTSFRLCISPALPLTSQGVFLENIQHWVLLLPVHLGSPGSLGGCLGLSGMESPFLVGNPELRAALRAGEELCDTARTRVLPSPSRSEPGLPFPTGNNERDASHLPADVCGCSSSSQAWRGGSTGSPAPAETLSILCEPRGAERSRFQ